MSPRRLRLLAPIFVLLGGPAWGERARLLAPPEVTFEAGTPTITATVHAPATGMRAREFTLRISSGDDSQDATLTAASLQTFRDSQRDLDLVILVQGGAGPTTAADAYPAVKKVIDRVAGARREHTRVALLVYGEGVRVAVPLGPAARVRGAAFKPAAAATAAATAPGASAATAAATAPGASAATASAPGPSAATAPSAPGTLREAIDAARALLEPSQARRVIFVIGDGEDPDARFTGSRTGQRLERAGMELYFLAYDPAGMSDAARLRVANLARSGDYEFVSLPEQLTQVAWVMRERVNDVYLLRFVAGRGTNAARRFDGKEHGLSVIAGLDETDPAAVLLPRPPPLAGAQASPSRGARVPLIVGGIVAAVTIATILVWRRRRRAPAEEALATSPPALGPPPIQPVPPPGVGPSAPGAARPPPQAAAWLVAQNGPAGAHSFPLHPGRNTLGRDWGCDVRIDDPALYGWHADLIVAAGRVTLIECSSVALKRVLHDGEAFTCGHTTFMVKA